MAKESLETNPFMTVPTALVSVSSGLLWVPESAVKEDSLPARGTTLRDFMPNVHKGRAIVDGFGGYKLTMAGELQDGWRAFWFAKERTAEQIATAYLTETEIRLGMLWPAVLSGGTSANVLTKKDGGGTYVSGTAYKFTYAKPVYDGPTKVVTEFFASHTDFSIATPSTMQPMGCTLDYGIGSISIPPCLHGSVTLEYVIPSDHPTYAAATFSDTFAATTPATRPNTLVLRDGYRFENGIYIRQKETAYAP
jgi:hypothetical protein